MANQSQLLLVDGMALLFRAFYATAPSGQFMFNDQGIPTNGVQGFLRHLLLALNNRKPTHVAVCWDMGAKTFRHQLFDGYKANRAAPPVEMVPQFDLAKDMIEAFGIPNVGLTGYEADDCIGTLAKTMHKTTDVSIVTGDRDLLQLLDQGIRVDLLQKGYGNYRSYNQQMFSEDYGVTPLQYIDVKALMGDSSDGYPGVRGIGEKTAVKLIQRFGSIEHLLDQLDLLPAGQKKKISTDLDMLRLSRELAEINCHAPIALNLDEAEYVGIPDTFVEKVNDMGMKLVKYDLVQLRWNKMDQTRQIAGDISR
ncbi:5'-3' exonuclease H3TH domain-containing protein [Sporolactobacillus kofuensis]|uniref:5'-3' exonuclease n=1 Tax=Sporolactobacillus kofuensis TaxID=269672 RepID=A0ABW1WDF1_9BACL|nr:5'-3' exonuclease [Sporolactobacillus kofuensis]MCO7176744.1 5'-3' exonuclease [Sporolactobacillus kofuensis]